MASLNFPSTISTQRDALEESDFKNSQSGSDPIARTMEVYRKTIAQESGLQMDYLTNCSSLDDVRVFCLSDIHGHLDVQNVNSQFVQAHAQPGDQVLLEDYLPSSSLITGMIDLSCVENLHLQLGSWDLSDKQAFNADFEDLKRLGQAVEETLQDIKNHPENRESQSNLLAKQLALASEIMKGIEDKVRAQRQMRQDFLCRSVLQDVARRTFVVAGRAHLIEKSRLLEPTLSCALAQRPYLVVTLFEPETAPSADAHSIRKNRSTYQDLTNLPKTIGLTQLFRSILAKIAQAMTALSTPPASGLTGS